MKAFLLLILFSSFVYADCAVEDSIPNQFIVRLKNPEPPFSVQAVGANLKIRKQNIAFFKNHLVQHKLTHSAIFEAPISGEITLTAVQNLPAVTYMVEANSLADMNALSESPLVDTIERNCLFKIQGDLVPTASINDPQMSQMWGLNKIQIEDAWTISRGSTNVIIAISDTGVDYKHQDLKANMWVNTAEVAGNKVDDDKNGCVDDIYGCDFADGTGDPMPNGSSLSHGTHVAGTAAAVGNNGLGATGIVQLGRIMAVKGFTSTGVGSSDALLKTIYYAVNNGARVVNCSWGRQGSSSSADIEAFKYAHDHGVTMVVAAGNDNMDSANFSPANISTVITVAATDSQDQIATFSNWGTSIEVAAPGGKGYDSSGNTVDGIFSTLPNNSYGKYIGTSMAAPHVTGLVGLILSINPNLTPSQVLKILQDGGDLIHVTTYQSGKKFDYKRINAFGSAKLALASAGGAVGNCQPGAVNCASNASSLPSGTSSFSQSSGCGSIGGGKGGSSGSGTMGAFLMLLLPMMSVLSLKLYAKAH